MSRRKTLIILIWLALWQLLAVFIRNKILLVGPVQVVIAFFGNIYKEEFIKTVFLSTGKILLGFVLGLILGLILAVASYMSKPVKEFLAPLFAVLKAIPVVSFVVLLLIWSGAPYVSVFVTFLVALPNIYVNSLAGLDDTDKKLIEMADVFGISRYNRAMFIYRRPLMEHIRGTLKVTLGMCFKSGVAAEIIGVPVPSFGERLYMAKIYLETAELFAWTLTIILVSLIAEKLVLFILYDLVGARFDKLMPAHDRTRAKDKDPLGRFDSPFNKSFEGRKILDDVTLPVKEGGRYCVMEPSGTGKTTVFNIITGLETDDMLGYAGKKGGKISEVFQEDRLIPYLSPMQNIALVLNDDPAGKLPGDPIFKSDSPASSLSGGEKRRVAIARAVLADSDILLLDEPFTGLDEANKEKAAGYILDNLKGRTLIMNSHDAKEAALLGCEIINWSRT